MHSATPRAFVFCLLGRSVGLALVRRGAKPGARTGGSVGCAGLRSGAAGSEPQAGRQILLIRGRARNARTDVRRVYDYSLNYFHISYV